MSSIAATEGNLHIVWQDKTAGNSEVFYKQIPAESLKINNHKFTSSLNSVNKCLVSLVGFCVSYFFF
jgi:hypothetical protein